MSTVKDHEVKALMSDPLLWSECGTCRGKGACQSCLSTGRVPLSHEDAEWLAGQPPMFKTVVARYGRKTFSIVMMAGIVNHSMNLILASKPPKAVAQAVAVATGIFNNVFNLALEGMGISQSVFASCKEDVERLGMLAGDGSAAGRIILPS